MEEPANVNGQHGVGVLNSYEELPIGEAKKTYIREKLQGVLTSLFTDTIKSQPEDLDGFLLAWLAKRRSGGSSACLAQLFPAEEAANGVTESGAPGATESPDPSNVAAPEPVASTPALPATSSSPPATPPEAAVAPDPPSAPSAPPTVPPGEGESSADGTQATVATPAAEDTAATKEAQPAEAPALAVAAEPVVAEAQPEGAVAEDVDKAAPPAESEMTSPEPPAPVASKESLKAVAGEAVGGSAEPVGLEPDTAAPVDEPTAEELMKMHSAVRWGKPVDEVKPFMLPGPSSRWANAHDVKNGNTSLHIAAQNGHLELLVFLLAEGARVNEVNKAGNTALHMAVAYDFHFVCKALLDAKADGALINGEGSPAFEGLDGTKKDDDAWDVPLNVLKGSSNGSQFEVAIAALEAAAKDEVQQPQLKEAKIGLAQTGMQKKKLFKEAWTPFIERFTVVMRSL